MKLPENEATSTRGVPPFLTDEKAVNDYYPFGMTIAERSWQSTDYRYGYNMQEKSTEIDPFGNHNTAEFWEYDTRSARRWNLDPKPIVGISQYCTFTNNPIMYSDIKGDIIVDNYHHNAVKIDNKGNISFTKYATDDIKEVVSAMILTKTGRDIVKDMINEDHEIAINIDEKNQFYKDHETLKYYKSDKGKKDFRDKEWFAFTNNSAVFNPKTRKLEISASSMHISRRSLRNAIKKEGILHPIFSEFSFEKIIGGVGTHEGTHATDRVSGTAEEEAEAEKKPNENQEKYYEEYDKRNQNEQQQEQKEKKPD